MSGRAKSKKTAKSKMTKSEILATVADRAGIPKSKVAEVMLALEDVMADQLSKTGEFSMLGWFKIAVKRKPAKPSRQGMNPFTKQMQTFKAQPAKNVIKVRPQKKVKEMV